MRQRIMRLKRWIGRQTIGTWRLVQVLFTPTVFWLALVGVVLLGSILGLVFGGWDWFRTLPSEGQSAVTTESRSTTIRNVGFVIAGVVTLVFAIWRGVVAERQAGTAEQEAQTAQQGLMNERYQKGREALGNSILSVRSGGIPELRQLASEQPEQYHMQIMQLFCAFVRNPAGEAEGPVMGYDHDGEPIRGLREDVQEVMYAIGRRSDAGINLELATETFPIRSA